MTAASAAYLNIGLELTASRCDVKVTSMEWSFWPGRSCPPLLICTVRPW
jgi:hypothetical protein